MLTSFFDKLISKLTDENIEINGPGVLGKKKISQPQAP